MYLMGYLILALTSILMEDNGHRTEVKSEALRDMCKPVLHLHQGIKEKLPSCSFLLNLSTPATVLLWSPLHHSMLWPLSEASINGITQDGLLLWQLSEYHLMSLKMTGILEPKKMKCSSPHLPSMNHLTSSSQLSLNVKAHYCSTA